MKKQHEKVNVRIDTMGIGWIIDTKNNIIWHSGGTSNYNSYIGFDKENEIGVVILSYLLPSSRVPASVMGAKIITELQDDHK